MKFIDLNRQYEVIGNDIQNQIQQVLQHGQFIMGEEVFELERQLASHTGSKHCITLNSGTDALIVALRALQIGSEDEVILPVYSFFSTVEAVLLTGAKPVFVDIDPATYNIDTSRIESVITDKTRAIMVVDLYGQPADYNELGQLSQQYDLPLVADAAQSFGGSYKNQQVGSLATITCTSFFPSKPLGTYGDGGACLTDNNELAEIMRQVRNHGQHNRYEHVRLGFNSRLDTMQAAVLLVKLKILTQEIKTRQKLAAYYTKQLQDKVVTPTIRDDRTSAFAQYTIQVNNRDVVQEHLRNAGIPTCVHYPMPMNWQPYFKDTPIYRQRFPQAIQAGEHVLSLPFHPYLTHKEQDQVITELIDALEA